MRKITTTAFFLLLFSVIFHESLIIGGVKGVFAAESYSERGVYAVTIENNSSKVKTVMTVFAESEQDANDHVALNGWTVIGVKRLSQEEAKAFDLSSDGVSSVTPDNVEIKPLKDSGVLSDPNLKSANDGTESTAGYPPIVRRDNPSSDVQDNLNLLPTSPDLEFIAVYHYDLGVIEPIRNPVNNGKISSLDKGGSYVVFGHADTVPVGENASYGSNFELSYKRASFIKEIMVRAGIPADSIRTVGLGTTKPVVKNSEGGSPANRRVEIYGFKSGGR